MVANTVDYIFQHKAEYFSNHMKVNLLLIVVPVWYFVTRDKRKFHLIQCWLVLVSLIDQFFVHTGSLHRAEGDYVYKRLLNVNGTDNCISSLDITMREATNWKQSRIIAHQRSRKYWFTALMIIRIPIQSLFPSIHGHLWLSLRTNKSFRSEPEMIAGVSKSARRQQGLLSASFNLRFSSIVEVPFLSHSVWIA